jgi:hypothetical protein
MLKVFNRPEKRQVMRWLGGWRKWNSGGISKEYIRRIGCTELPFVKIIPCHFYSME